MNAKKSLVWFVVGIVWLAVLVAGTAKGASTLDVDTQAGILWLGGSILWGILGVFGGVKLNKVRD